jgi:hypothetical protein
VSLHGIILKHLRNNSVDVCHLVFYHQGYLPTYGHRHVGTERCDLLQHVLVKKKYYYVILFLNVPLPHAQSYVRSSEASHPFNHHFMALYFSFSALYSLKCIVSKLTIKFLMRQKCGKMKDYNKKITTSAVYIFASQVSDSCLL